MFQADFDKSKHLSDKAIKRRRLEREKLKALEKEREDRVRREREEEEFRREEERLVCYRKHPTSSQPCLILKAENYIGITRDY